MNDVVSFDEDSEKINKAFEVLDEFAEQWAESANLSRMAKQVNGNESAILAMMINCFQEGCFRGRHSTLLFPTKGSAK